MASRCELESPMEMNNTAGLSMNEPISQSTPGGYDEIWGGTFVIMPYDLGPINPQKPQVSRPKVQSQKATPLIQNEKANWDHFSPAGIWRF